TDVHISMSEQKYRTRAVWLSVLARHRGSLSAPDSSHCRSEEYDFASRDRIIEIQNEKLAALTPFLYENSAFYRRRFDRLGLAPTDIRTIDDLPKWPPVDKAEMMADV